MTHSLHRIPYMKASSPGKTNPGAFPIRTALQAAEAQPEHLKLIKWLSAECGRLGFDLNPAEPVDEFALNRAFRAAGSDAATVERKMAIKSAMAQLRLIQP